MPRHNRLTRHQFNHNKISSSFKINNRTTILTACLNFTCSNATARQNFPQNKVRNRFQMKVKALKNSLSKQKCFWH